MIEKFKLIKIVLIADVILGLLIGAWSRWRVEECGYDCGLLGVKSGPAAIMGWYIGIAITLISFIVLLIVHIKDANR